MLRVVVPGYFEALPRMPQRGPSSFWWLTTSYSSWVLDGLFHALCHAIGYAGPCWDVQSRTTDSLFHLTFSLTKEFLPVSDSIPLLLHGAMAIRFFRETMLPNRFVRFPSGLSSLLNMLRVRWGYFNGNAIQARASLLSLLPLMLGECPNVRRFLLSSTNVSA